MPDFSKENDADGITMAQAWQKAGRDPAQMGEDSQTVRRIRCFVELHVEQGRAMVDMDDVPVAVGTDIWPHGRWRVDLPGRADHAGTTALGDRDDALLKASAFIQRVRYAAERQGEKAVGERIVATVGKLQVEPGGINAIASHVTAWVDARGSREPDVKAVVAELEGVVHDLGGVWREESWTPTTAFDATFIERCRAALGGVPALGTGAGHDAGILSNAGVPTAMLFVRNPTGTSHSPDEFAERDDCLAGVDALVHVLKDLAG